MDKLITALRHPEPTRAALAIQVLSEMLSEARAVEPLVELLDVARDAYVLMWAARALGRFGDTRAVPALGRVALDLTKPLVVRLAAVEALAEIGGVQAKAVLHGALSDPSLSVRERAAGALSIADAEG